MKRVLFLFALIILFISPVSAILTYPSSWSGINNLYFSDARSDIGNGSYGTLLNYANGITSPDENITVTSGESPQYIDGYMTPAGLPGGGVELLSGLRQYNMYDYASSVSQPSYLTFNVSIYHGQWGNYTTIYNDTSVAISSTTPTLDRSPLVEIANNTFGSQDRILIEIYGYTTRSSATIHFENGGNNVSSYVQSGYFLDPSPLYPTGGNESYDYDSTGSTPLSEWIIIVIGSIAFLICEFWFKIRDENGDVSTQRIVFSLVACLTTAFAAWLSMEIIIPSGVATNVIYQEPIISILFVVASIISFANFIYSITLPEITKPDKKDYNKEVK